MIGSCSESCLLSGGSIPFYARGATKDPLSSLGNQGPSVELLEVHILKEPQGGSL